MFYSHISRQHVLDRFGTSNKIVRNMRKFREKTD